MMAPCQTKNCQTYATQDIQKFHARHNAENERPSGFHNAESSMPILGTRLCLSSRACSSVNRIAGFMQPVNKFLQPFDAGLLYALSKLHPAEVSQGMHAKLNRAKVRLVSGVHVWV